MKRYNKSQSILVRCNGVSFYTTAGGIRAAVGNSTSFNAAVQKALDSLEYMRQVEQFRLGVTGTWEGYSVQLDIV